MPRSCSSSDMAGTAMLYPPGTDGAAVTDVRLHGSRPSQHPELRNTRTHWIRGFNAFAALSATRWTRPRRQQRTAAVGTPLDRRGAEFARARAQPDRGPVGVAGFHQFAG